MVVWFCEQTNDNVNHNMRKGVIGMYLSHKTSMNDTVARNRSSVMAVALLLLCAINDVHAQNISSTSIVPQVSGNVPTSQRCPWLTTYLNNVSGKGETGKKLACDTAQCYVNRVDSRQLTPNPNNDVYRCYIVASDYLIKNMELCIDMEEVGINPCVNAGMNFEQLR